MRQEGVRANGGTDTVRESQGVSECTVNSTARLSGKTGQVVVPAESGTDVSAHGFWKRRTTLMFNVRIVNLDEGS